MEQTISAIDNMAKFWRKFGFSPPGYPQQQALSACNILLPLEFFFNPTEFLEDSILLAEHLGMSRIQNVAPLQVSLFKKLLSRTNSVGTDGESGTDIRVMKPSSPRTE